MRTPALLDGPLPRLPHAVDVLARGWAGATGRVRAVVRTALLAVLLVAAAGGVARGPWGPPVDVLVTTTAVRAGDAVRADTVTLVARPTELVPPNALTAPAQVPPDTITLVPLPPGTVLTTDHLVAGGPGGLATPGTAVVPVDATLLPALPVGTRLDLAVPGLDGAARVAARDVVLVADDGTWRWLRVARADVVAVAEGVSDGRLVAAVLPPAPPAASP